MKSLFAWVNSKIGHTNSGAAAAVALPLVDFKAVVPDSVPAAKPVTQAKQAPVSKPTHLRSAPIEDPRTKPIMPSSLFTGGPELVISVKAGTVYGTCPYTECGAKWNVRERLLRHRLTATAEAKALTCPSCDHPVALPQTVDLRKLS